MDLKQYPQYKHSEIEWIGRIPEGWEFGRLKNKVILKYGQSLSDLERVDGPIGVYGSNGLIGMHNRAITKGETIIIGRKGSYGKLNFSQESCFPIDTTFFIDNKCTRLNLRYLFYVLSQLELDAGSRDSAVPGLSREEAYEKIIPYISAFEQNQIAKYLDDKTSEINEVIEKNEHLIKLLEEKRASLINRAVTRGLDPKAELKDSGIEWIGKIPDGWLVVPFKKYLESIVDYRGATPEKTQEGTFLVTGRNIKSGKIDYEISKEYVCSDEYSEIMHRGKPQIGDLLFTTEAPLGEVANVDREDIALAQRIIKMRGKKGKLDNFYLKYYIMSPLFQAHLQSQATGSTALGIKASNMCYLRLIVPTFNEQRSIVGYLDTKINRIDITVEKVENRIQLLEEYKKSLINNVVTGKIDVREHN